MKSTPISRFVKRYLPILFCLLGLTSCTPSDEEDTLGSIYGVVTVKETAELMRATGVELYKDAALLLKTVTFDDGHYEFDDLKPGGYTLKVVAAGYSSEEYRVKVEAGRTARADMQLERIETYMTVQTLEPEVTDEEVTFKGDYSRQYVGYEANETGFYYSTSPNPETNGKQVKSTGSFSATVKGLKKGTYYVKAYAINKVGTEWGETRAFEVQCLPRVATLPASNVSDNAATLNGVIEYDGDPAYTERGFVYSRNFQSPTIEDPASATTRVPVSGKSKEFSANIANLTSNTIYYVRAYVINESGTFYGDPLSVGECITLQEAGIMIQRFDISSGSKWETADKQCTESRVGGYSDWRLPTSGECSAIYKAMKQGKQLNIDTSRDYWTSELDIYRAISFNFSTGSSYYKYCSGTYSVRAVRTI